MRTLAIVTILLLVVGVALYGAWRWNTRPDLVTVRAPLPENFPAAGFSHELFAQLLARYVGPRGRVNYAAWLTNPADLRQFDSYLAALAHYSPENAPQRFPNPADRLAYWTYAYNALVIKAILIHWPIDSVLGVKAPVEIVQGLGFFYRLKFLLGGHTYSLYQIENDKVFGPGSDPRLHFVLNCGSASCPILRPQLPTGDALQPFLANAAADFIADAANLAIDDATETLYLSTLFKWYRNEFVATLPTPATDGKPSATNRGQDPALVDYLARIASPDLAAQLTRRRFYTVQFRDYDWSLNQQQTQAPNAAAANPPHHRQSP